MRERRPDSAEGPVLIAIDHLFVGSEADGLAQAVYDALGALDATWPAAIAPIAAADLATLVAAAREARPPGHEGDALQGAARRVGHVLERAPGAQLSGTRFFPGQADVDPQGGSVYTLGADMR